jgi:capsular polysaccharide transport system ATP-binding protein
MILQLDRVSKSYHGGARTRPILNEVSLAMAAGDKCGVLGRNGSGKSTLVRIMAGAEQPTSGVVRHGVRVSWPLAFGGGFQGGLTGLDNAKFIARAYCAPIDEVVAYVSDFAELGSCFREPVMTYSSGMRARLAFGLSLAIDFGCLLIDEIVAVGDHRFREKCERELFERHADKSWVIVSHDTGYIRAHCNRGFLIERGALREFDTVDETVAAYEALD